ncbi:unnamed protein product, partial [Musa textilis]
GASPRYGSGNARMSQPLHRRGGLDVREMRGAQKGSAGIYPGTAGNRPKAQNGPTDAKAPTPRLGRIQNGDL